MSPFCLTRNAVALVSAMSTFSIRAREPTTCPTLLVYSSRRVARSSISERRFASNGTTYSLYPNSVKKVMRAPETRTPNTILSIKLISQELRASVLTYSTHHANSADPSSRTHSAATTANLSQRTPAGPESRISASQSGRSPCQRQSPAIRSGRSRPPATPWGAPCRSPALPSSRRPHQYATGRRPKNIGCRPQPKAR